MAKQGIFECNAYFSFICVSFNRIFLYNFRTTTFDKDITPYIHVFICHAHYFLERYGTLKSFEMEAVEQLNYVNKLVFFGASNKGKENYAVTEQVRHQLCAFYYIQMYANVSYTCIIFLDYETFNAICCGISTTSEKGKKTLLLK